MRFIPVAALATGIMLAGLQTASAQVQLIFATVNPAGSLLNREAFIPWAERINAAGEGIIEIDVREGATLANYGNVYDRVLNDVIQIGWGIPSIVAGRFPRTEVSGLPFLTNSSEIGSVAMYELLESGLLDAEYEEIVPLAMVLMSQSVLHLVNEPQSLDDFSGVKFVAGSQIDSNKVQRLGGTPISLPLGDMYEGLQRGTVDAALIGWTAYDSFNLGEVTSFHVEEPLGSGAAFIFMSRSKFDSLPPEAQQVLLDNSGLEESRRIGAIFDQATEQTRAEAEASPGNTVIQLTPEQSQAWRDRLDPLIDEWAARTPNGEAILDTLRASIAAETAK